MAFQLTGYRRPDGRMGIRNHILIIPTSGCAAFTAQKIAAQIPGALAIPNQNGCGQTKKDLKITRDVLLGYAQNPNVYGTLVIGLGCENLRPHLFAETLSECSPKPVHLLVIQEEGGMQQTIAKGTAIVADMVRAASFLVRKPMDVSELVIGTNCGGSDPTSGLAANPVMGYMCDRLVDLGATAVLCETTEFIGAEEILTQQAASPQVGQKILKLISDMENHLKMAGENLRDGNPSPGNIAAGITTLEEKSLGCIYKRGTRPIQEVFAYGEPINKKGLVIMDSPGYDLPSVCGLAASGCHAVVFSTGCGTPLGNAIMPVIKITGNAGTYKKLIEHIDFDTSTRLTQGLSVEVLGESLLKELFEVVNGRKTKAEVLGCNEFAICRVCNYV